MEFYPVDSCVLFCVCVLTERRALSARPTQRIAKVQDDEPSCLEEPCVIYHSIAHDAPRPPSARAPLLGGCRARGWSPCQRKTLAQRFFLTFCNRNQQNNADSLMARADRVAAQQHESSGLIIVDEHSEPRAAGAAPGFKRPFQEDRAHCPITVLPSEDLLRKALQRQKTKQLVYAIHIENQSKQVKDKKI